MFINLNQISKSFGSKLVLQDVSFQINAGDKIGLVGRNGSGKTTLFRLMQGEPGTRQRPNHEIAAITGRTHAANC